MRRICRVDDNQADIVQALRAVGCSVTPTHMVGSGFPDIVVGFRGRNVLVEIKDGSKAPARRRLTSDEAAWHKAWKGLAVVVETSREAVEVVLALCDVG